ncbi:MAG: hypothetical protein AAGA30_21700, partial [Planctomycetota bacterium]
MIKSISCGISACLLTGILFANDFVTSTNPLDGEHWNDKWKKVEEFQNKGLPKSAIKELNSIYDEAVKESSWAAATRAFCQRIYVEGQVNQPLFPFAIRQLNDAIPKSNQQMRPVLETVRACYLYQYYLQNQWRFRNRSQTSSLPSDDFETWDLTRILSEIDKSFTTALESADQLKKIPIADYDVLLEKGNIPDSHRPTLYDFVAFQALGFY